MRWGLWDCGQLGEDFRYRAGIRDRVQGTGHVEEHGEIVPSNVEWIWVKHVERTDVG